MRQESKAREDSARFCFPEYPSCDGSLHRAKHVTTTKICSSFKKGKCQQMVLSRLLERQRKQETESLSFRDNSVGSSQQSLAVVLHVQTHAAFLQMFLNCLGNCLFLNCLGEMCLLDLFITIFLFGHVVSGSFTLKMQSLHLLCSQITGKEEMSLFCRARYSHLICYGFSFISLPSTLFCFACCVCIQKG